MAKVVSIVAIIIAQGLLAMLLMGGGVKPGGGVKLASKNWSDSDTSLVVFILFVIGMLTVLAAVIGSAP